MICARCQDCVDRASTPTQYDRSPLFYSVPQRRSNAVTAGQERARAALPRITTNKIPPDGHGRPRVLMLMNQGQSRRLAARTPGGCLEPRALQEQASTCLTAQASNNVWRCVGPLVDLIGPAMYNSSMARPPRLQASLSAGI